MDRRKLQLAASARNLTLGYSASTIAVVRSLGRALVAMFVLVAFCGSAWAACVEGAATPAQQMACCKDGQFTCAHGSPSDCCATEATTAHSTVASIKLDPVLAPSVVFWAVLANISISATEQARFDSPASPPHLDPGPPPYIAFSSLLI